MNNYRQPGDVVTLTAPSGGVTSGLGYKIGQLFVVAANTVAETLPFPGRVTGVCELVKNSGESWTEGALVYWDDGASNVTTTATGNLLIGVATAAAGTSDVLGLVRLSGTPEADQP